MELEISRNYNSLCKRLASINGTCDGRGRWTQDIFGDGTVGTSNELNVVMN